MLKVKITPYRPGLGKIMYRQTKGGALTSLDGKYRFYIDEEVADPDFWFIQGKGLKEGQTVKVAPENVVLLTTEPGSVLRYPKSYTNQFGMVCTSQQDLSHPNKMLAPPVLPWFVGYKKVSPSGYIVTHDYDSIKSSQAPQKTKLLSVITSNKAFTRGHVDRIRFVNRIKCHFGDKIDIFGRGFNDFNDKWDVLAPYKYHIVIENSSEPYYWTEKIGDCFLTETFPIYYGCTNLDNYFPCDAFEPFDIHDVDKSIALIDSLIVSDRYERFTDVLHQCRQKMLDNYNMFEFIASICDRLNPLAVKKDVTIKPCQSMHNSQNVWNYLVGRNYYKFLLKVRGNQ